MMFRTDGKSVFPGMSGRGRGHLDCYVRVMQKEDIDQVTEIDREAFPTQWPPTNYSHELRNRLARYVVVCDRSRETAQSADETPPGNNSGGLLARIKNLLKTGRWPGNGQSHPSGHYIIGFVGFWIMADEAHVTAIAVRESHRRQGIGELMMATVLDMAADLGARICTLEVRVSNAGAQQLYSKYGFARVGMRRAYYTDNREDAMIMSTESITSAIFKVQLRELKQSLAKKTGISLQKIRV
jgi:ribosomal-protein-alanine N-acetyltransferase